VLWGFPSMFFGMRPDVTDAVPGLASVHTLCSMFGPRLTVHWQAAVTTMLGTALW
jgi:hypothetical protein